MISHFVVLSLSFLFMNKKSTISILFSIEMMFFIVILLYSMLSDLSMFFMVMCIIVISATFSLAIFVKTLSSYSSESQQMFLEWGNSMWLYEQFAFVSSLLVFSVFGTYPWSG